jgi:hypothetical protein
MLSAFGTILMACTSSTPESACASPGGTCGVGVEPNGGTPSDGSIALSSCAWPASLDPTDASDGQCTAARTLLACTDGDGGIDEGCISNDPTQCPSDGVTVPGATFTCHDQCAPTEYGAVCGGIGPTAPPAASPPSACRSMGVTPGGTQFYCCPCGSGGNEGGPSDDGADAAMPIPEAFVSAFVGPGGASASACGYAAQLSFLQIGSPVVPEPSTITSGMDSVSLSCQVDPSGGGFNIHLSAEISGVNGGSLSVAGQVSTSGGSGIQGVFTSATAGTFSDSNCTVTFTYNESPVPVAPPIAAGRIWGHVDCADASSGTDGGNVRTCDASADFLFENCE